MRTTRSKQRSARLEALLDRWLEASRNVRKSLADLRAPRGGDDGPEARPTPAELPAGAADTGPPDLASLPTERSEALAALCDRLLQELGGPEVKAAEIRFVVHKHDRPADEQMDAKSAANADGSELAWELRRLIASADGTLADVVRALENRPAGLDETGRELLLDEVSALEIDLGELKAQLAGPTDWDAQLECLLAEEITPFEDLSAEEEGDDDERPAR